MFDSAMEKLSNMHYTIIDCGNYELQDNDES